MACSVDGCARRVTARGMCNPHYQRFLRHGTPYAGGPKRNRPPLERFYGHCVFPANGCWIWTGPKDKDGYGKLTLPGHKTIRAHRFGYEALVGPIPEGLVLDHIVCDTPSCVNPAHLTPTTARANTLRSKKNHCRRGHVYGPGTVRHYTTRGGYKARECLVCKRLGERARYAQYSGSGLVSGTDR